VKYWFLGRLAAFSILGLFGSWFDTSWISNWTFRGRLDGFSNLYFLWEGAFLLNWSRMGVFYQINWIEGIKLLT